MQISDNLCNATFVAHTGTTYFWYWSRPQISDSDIDTNFITILAPDIPAGDNKVGIRIIV